MKPRISSLLLCMAVSSAAFSGTGKVNELQAKIQTLNAQMAELQGTVELQKAEIERLKTLCLKNGIDVSPKGKVKRSTEEAISQPMFGIFLGEKLSEVRKRFKITELDLPMPENVEEEFSFEATSLRMKENDNMLEILYKLKLLAIDNGVIDTAEYHNHTNELRQNHKFRLEVIEFVRKNDYLGVRLPGGGRLFEQISESQIQCHQMKLEYIKLGKIESFDEVEQAYQQFFIDTMQTANKFVPKQNPKHLDNPCKQYWVTQDPNVIKSCVIKTFKDQVWNIVILFKDASKQNFEVIEKLLRKKYQIKDEPKEFRTDDLEQVFQVSLDNTDVTIYLELETRPMVKNTLTLTYAHLPLFNRVRAEIERRRAEKVSSDL